MGSAEPISKTFQYSCPFPMIGVQQVAVTINTDMPKEIATGQPTGEFDIKAVSDAGEKTRQGLNMVGAKTIEGTADAKAVLDSPDGTLPVTVRNNIPKQPVPDTGSLIVDAFGKTPSLTFSKPGTAKITLGNILLTLTPRDENGEETGLGTFESDCTLNSGEDDLLHTFTITDGGDTGGTDTGGTDTGGTDTGGTDTGGTDTGGTDTGGTDTGGGGGDPIKLAYDLQGTSHIKAGNGDVPLSGDIHVDFDLPNQKYVGDLKLDDTTGKFSVYGMTAESDIKFVQTRKTTGTYDGSKLTSSSEMYIYLTEVRSNGFPLGGGPDCRTVTPVPINMEGDGFDPFTGGKISGVYDLPEFENCGQNTAMINQFAAGPGNTVELTLTPKDSGGTDTGGTDTGGTETGGTDTGGTDTGSSSGGYDMGGYDMGGYDMGGYDMGGYDMGGYDMGG
ncbi:MAG: DUF6801 domain-containing protein, partial [Natronosporangium sp.]